MASIPGSHFIATEPGKTVNAVETSGGHLPPPKNGDFNLEVWTGNPADAPSSPAHGYQGLAVLSDGGKQIDLISGAYDVTDQGLGFDSIIASGDDQTISGGAANVTLTITGQQDVANGGGTDTITVTGNFDTVNGNGNDLITVFGTNDSVAGGGGNDTINIFGLFDSVTAGSGNELIDVFGSSDRVVAGSGNDTINLFGSNLSSPAATATKPSTCSDQTIRSKPALAMP
jgi:Ca2+-binding RTX toxin-like protein